MHADLPLPPDDPASKGPRVLHLPVQASERLHAANEGSRDPEARTAPLRLSCVVPSWNEAASLDGLLTELSTTLTQLADAWEVIVVDDGSTDDTMQTLRPWLSRPGIRVVQLSRNFGKEAALSAGLHAARGNAVVMLDADRQHPPGLIQQMVARWRAGVDVVYAVRRHRDDETAIKRWGSATFYRMINGADRFEVPAGAGDFRLLDRQVVNALLELPERNRFMKGLYAWVGFRSEALPYQPAPRAHGRSSFNLWRLARLSMDGLTAFTTWPLRAVSLLGTLLAGLSLSYGGWLTLQYMLYGNPVSGWTTIAVGLLLFSGVQLISLGIVGEYVGRIFEEVKARPLYVVRRELGDGLPRQG